MEETGHIFNEENSVNAPYNPGNDIIERKESLETNSNDYDDIPVNDEPDELPEASSSRLKRKKISFKRMSKL